MNQAYIITYSGKAFSLINPQRHQIVIEDIAHALARENRFNGHTFAAYSVAQHCYLASFCVPAEFAFEALMHDASEAYIKDMPSPIKQLLPDYKVLEKRIELAIAERFGLPRVMSEPVKYADLIMLATEKRDLGIVDNNPWPLLQGIQPLDDVIKPEPADVAEGMFLARFYELNATTNKGQE